MVGYFRFFLASLVLYSHINFPSWDFVLFKINQGVFAVFCFYIISGYFTALIYDRFTGPNRILKFYSDRIFRVMPAFITVMVVVILLNIVMYEPLFGIKFSEYKKFSNFVLGILQPLNGIITFLFNDFSMGPYFIFTPVYTLALEVKYFTIFPFFAESKKKYVVFVIAIGIGLVLNSSFKSNPDIMESYTYRYLIGTLPLFLIGYLSFYFKECSIPKAKYYKTIVFFIGTTLLGRLILKETAGTSWLGEMGLAFMLCPFLLETLMKFKPSKGDQIFGYISYGIFLTHLPVLNFLHIQRTGFSSFMIGYPSFLLALFTSSLISLIIYFFIEKPIIRLRHRHANKFIPL